MFPLLAWASVGTKSWDKNNKNPRSKISMTYLGRENRLWFSSLILAFTKHELCCFSCYSDGLWIWCVLRQRCLLLVWLRCGGRWWWCDVPCPGPCWRLLSRTSWPPPAWPKRPKQDHNSIWFGSWQYINSYNLCRFQRCSMLSWVYYTVLEKFGKLVTVDLYQIVIHWNLYITTLYYATMTKQSLVFKDSLLLSYKCYVWYLIKSAATLYLSTCCSCHFLSIFSCI